MTHFNLDEPLGEQFLPIWSNSVYVKLVCIKVIAICERHPINRTTVVSILAKATS